MNAASFICLILVILIVAGAAWRVYKMVKNNDMCYACSGNCKGCEHCNPINCSLKKQD